MIIACHNVLFCVSIVEDYLKEAKNHVPEAMKVMEDALLIWLAY